MISSSAPTNTSDSRATPQEGVEVWTVDLNPPDAFIAAAGDFLSAEEVARVERFTNPAARRNYLVAHSALRRLLATRLALSPRDIPLAAGPHGKPELAGEFKGRMHFNLSHSGALGLIALSPSTEVGVDVERIRALPDAARLAERFFTPSESAALNQLPEAECHLTFFRLWTRKEALVKATGEGIAGLRRFEVAGDTDGGLIAVEGRQDDTANWTLQSWSPADGYLAAVALSGPGARITFHHYPVAC